MEAGRELDALVAEKVFGKVAKHIETDPNWREWHDDEWFMADQDTINEIEAERGMGGYSHYLLPRYSTDIAAAWLVVDNLNARGWRVEIFSTARSGVDVQVCKWGGLHHEGDYAESASTAPHAICLAALRAVGAI